MPANAPKHKKPDRALRPGSAARRVHRELIEKTLVEVVERGIERISLRQIAAATGLSTHAIFQNFAGKADLLEATAAQAIELDWAFHRELEETAANLVCGHAGLADFMSAYIVSRARRDEARFLTELLVHLGDYPSCRPMARAWHDARMEFWVRLAAGAGLPGDLGKIMGGFVVMEEIYAQSLAQCPQYLVLMPETCRALTEHAANPAPSLNARESAAQRLAVEPLAIQLPGQSDLDQPVAARLLRAAVGLINEAGIPALTQRALAARSGVSASMISYHFGDMEQLTTEAVWHALVQGIPPQLDPTSDTSAFPASLPAWLDMIDAMLKPDSADRPGFYIGATRLTSQTSLLASRDPRYLRLIRYLRGLEGWGTYRISRTIPALAERIGRDHAAAFAIWNKSRALLRIVGMDQPEREPSLKQAASMVLPLPADMQL